MIKGRNRKPSISDEKVAETVELTRGNAGCWPGFDGRDGAWSRPRPNGAWALAFTRAEGVRDRPGTLWPSTRHGEQAWTTYVISGEAAFTGGAYSLWRVAGWPSASSSSRWAAPAR